MSEGQNKRPFAITHRRRKDGLAAMLLGERGGETIYRVQWIENGKRHENTLGRPSDTFHRLFAKAPANV